MGDPKLNRADRERRVAVPGRGSSHDRPRPDTQCGEVGPSGESPAFHLKLSTKDLPPNDICAVWQITVQL